MVATSFIVAASSVFALTFGAPVPRSLAERAVSYITFGGTGSASDGWPQLSDWKSFDDLWTANLPTISSSCSAHSWGQDNSDAETAAIKSALQSTASSSGLEASFLLAIMMQESRGCVRVPTTNYGVRNPGLMQDHDGAATCGEPVTTPCPDSQIQGMISQSIGTADGTSSWGLMTTYSLYKAAGGSQSYYMAARGYNSGSVASDKNLGEGVATHCYASDIANRLLGFTGDSACSEASVATANSANSGYGASTGNTGNTGNTPTTTTTTPTPAKTSAAAATSAAAKPSATTIPLTQDGNSSCQSCTSKATLTQAPGASTSCTSWYPVTAGDTCDKVAQAAGITFAKLQSLNSGLDSTCSNLWANASYCVKSS